MQALLGLLLAVQVGPGSPYGPAATTPHGPAATTPPLVSPGAKSGPSILFEIRKISVASPEWRGKFIPTLKPIARQEGSAVWASIRTAFAGCSLIFRVARGPKCSRRPR